MKQSLVNQDLSRALYRAEQVRELDRIAIQEYSISGLTLMTRAGQDTFKLLQDLWPQAQSIIVFCGSGNNAGDGYIVAHEALLAGLQISVIRLESEDNLSADAVSAYQTYIKSSGKVFDYHLDIDILADVIVDGLLGTGLSRPLTGVYAQAVATINRSHCPVLALDIPSGVHADTGCVMASAVKADHTLSFIGLKQGMFTGQAVDYCGQIHFSSLDCPEQIYQRISNNVKTVITQAMLPRSCYTHKGNNGHVLLIGGDQGYSGAIRLSAEAAARSGAGLISIATHAVHADFLNLNRPELMCHGVASDQQLLPLLKRANVCAIGPGLGQSQWAATLFATALAADKIMVVDADALNLLAKNPCYYQQWVLTPHPGEAARLLGCTVAKIQQDRFQAALDLQQTFGGIVLLKGAGTLITDGKMIYVATSGNPGMASAGMGDLLTGIIAALIAQGSSLIEATTMAVDIHGKAGDQAATEGERGLLASDLLTPIRQLINKP